jgi:hypothetical protein
MTDDNDSRHTTPTKDKYILGGPDGHSVIPCNDLLEWGQWLEDNQSQTIVAYEIVMDRWEVSTVFIGLDMDFGGFGGLYAAFQFGRTNPRPIVFETMAFELAPGWKTAVPHDGEPYYEFVGRIRKSTGVQERCSTWDEAVEQHRRIVAEFRKAANG